MSDEPRGPTTEELRARVLAHHREVQNERYAMAKRCAETLAAAGARKGSTGWLEAVRRGDNAPETFPP